MLALIGFNAAAEVTPNGLVILLTDYGADSIQVGALKGSVYTVFEDARIDAITNSIPKGDIVRAAYALAEIADEFPRGTVFCCVVDPANSPNHPAIVLETSDGRIFVAPDNGLLARVAELYGKETLHANINPDFWRPGAGSHTYHGRDIFGPLAGMLADGARIDAVGPELEQMRELDLGKVGEENGAVVGRVVRVDEYGNMATNIRPAHLLDFGFELGEQVDVTIGDTQFFAPIVTTYGDVGQGEKLILVQRSGFIACAVNLGNMAEMLGEGAPARVVMKKVESP